MASRFQAAVTLDLSSLRPLLARIARLEGKRVRSKVIKNGLNAGGRIVRKAMKANAPVRTGKLKKSITIETKASGTAVTGETKIGPSWPEGAHAHLTEMGTVLRSTKGRRDKPGSTGHSTGFVRGSHWMERAFRSSEDAALAAMASRIEDEISLAIANG